MSKGPVPPSAPEFWAVFRRDSLEVLWFTLEKEQAAAKALAFSALPEYRDVPIGYTLCKHPDYEKSDEPGQPN